VNRVFVVLAVSACVAALVMDVVPALRPDDAEKIAPALSAVTGKALGSATAAAKLAIGLTGVLALWMGLMRVAEAAGLVQILARVLRPVLTRLFPDVPEDHPAMGAMVMNIAANLLGLGNAATPLGLEAMRQLDSLNEQKGTATNAMCLFLAINTSGLTLIPARAIAMRQEAGSVEATSILLPTLLATACSTIIAVIAAKSLQRFFPSRPTFDEDAA
jgi:spore maturation protein SpmA